LGLVLCGRGYSAWREFRSYTVIAEGTVSQRTPTFAAVRFEGQVPGGSGTLELSYRVISGTRSDTPPSDGPPYALGDKVRLIHPLGRPSQARLPEAVAPAAPLWLSWVGLAGVVVALVVLALNVLPRSTVGSERANLAAKEAPAAT
jgi:hypothetical protein